MSKLMPSLNGTCPCKACQRPRLKGQMGTRLRQLQRANNVPKKKPR